MHVDHSELDRRTLLRAGLGAATVAVVGSELAFPAAAQADPGADLDWIYSCDEWGARPPADPLSVSAIPTNKIIVHHMAFPNVTDYSEAQAIKLARDCQDLHMDGNGWSDTGQHFTISRGGYVLEGRRGSLERLQAGDRQMISAHCPGENGRAIGIENEGTYVTETPPEALLDSLVKLCTTICRQYGLSAHDIFGHWDFRTTLCPGAAFYRQFPMLRRRVFRELGTDLADVPARRWPDLWRFVGSPSVRVVQYLLAHRGYTVPVNSVFDAATVAAVQDWQSRNGIPVDVDATLTTPTWETLVPELDKDASGIPVSAVQFMLNFKGWTEVAVTGEYDYATKKAVQDLQALHGLPRNGKVTTSTWCVLVGGVVRQSFRHR
ncbi:Peptidoglycan-binding (PGRP) domain of peptidoglycan hydrolases-containing protein [Micromonospora echinaurantiaca]|uniref:Peptidoglycan-binding (PGRP) domain of peptidoglycan hydrolases-containing protein n=1 Tax=Micromonospora echinaurantiaca TaxID=47857 RepID=A0A1C5HPW2_9ACTN|nr:N-acetylmuramoyl-L-alanine amidase [Micromonospora echinaurantiaca]SCG47923.1 Peptidoglycan-binding (PGRP) domain of peptidoglycan hydrolases-containing protein [Micromonospora echinaurantiaca]